jgi:hypothetical protein
MFSFQPSIGDSRLRGHELLCGPLCMKEPRIKSLLPVGAFRRPGNNLQTI